MAAKACEFIGETVKEGPVVQIMGDQASINGRDRGVGFRDCLTKNFPNLTLARDPDQGLVRRGRGRRPRRAPQRDAGPQGDLHARRRRVPRADAADPEAQGPAASRPARQGHIVIVSNDGIPQEFEAIRNGEIDATVSQPADLYAKYGLQYLKEAIAGKTFAPGPTDHDSTIVEVAPGVLEDQLAAPLVTKENVDDKSLWGNQL